jgi:hypothetical protein
MPSEPELEELERLKKESRESIKRAREMARAEDDRQGSKSCEPPLLQPRDEARFTGKHFRMNAATLGIETVGNHREAVQVPAGEVVVALSGLRSDHASMMTVRWNNKTLVMFVEDIVARGVQVDGRPSTGAV